MSAKHYSGMGLGRLARRLADDRRGVASILTAIGLVVLMGFAGLAVDVGKWLNAARNVQAAADQGAYSAAAAAGTNGCSGDVWKKQATAVIAARGYINNQNGAHVSPTCNSSNLTFTVTVSQTEPLWFTRLFLASGPMVSGTATAQLAGHQTDLCILALDGTDFYEGLTGSDASAFWLNGNTTVNVHCGVAVDSSNAASLATGGSSSLTATDIYMVGDDQGSPSGSSTIATSPTANNILRSQRPVADPYAGRVIPSYSCGAYNTTNWNTDLTQASSSTGASAHTFCGGLNLGPSTGSRVTINVAAGYYVIAGGSFIIGSKADIRATGGVTFILTGDNSHGYATVTLSGQGTLQVVAPTSGAYGGLAFFQDRNAPFSGTSSSSSSCGGQSSLGQNQLAGGSGLLVTGAVYFPNQSVCWGGSSSTSGVGKCTQLIAHTLSFTGNSDIQSNCAGTGIESIGTTTPQLIR